MDFRKNPFLDPQDDLERQQTSPRIHKNLAPRPHKNFIPVNLCQRRGLTRGAYKSTTIVNIYAYIALCQNNIRMNDNRQRWTNRGTEQRRRPTCTARPVLRQGSSSSMTQAACSLSHSGESSESSTSLCCHAHSADALSSRHVYLERSTPRIIAPHRSYIMTGLVSCCVCCRIIQESSAKYTVSITLLSRGLCRRAVSVRPSVTFVHSVESNKHIYNFFIGQIAIFDRCLALTSITAGPSRVVNISTAQYWLQHLRRRSPAINKRRRARHQ